MVMQVTMPKKSNFLALQLSSIVDLYFLCITNCQQNQVLYNFINFALALSSSLCSLIIINVYNKLTTLLILHFQAFFTF